MEWCMPKSGTTSAVRKNTGFWAGERKSSHCFGSIFSRGSTVQESRWWYLPLEAIKKIFQPRKQQETRPSTRVITYRTCTIPDLRSYAGTSHVWTTEVRRCSVKRTSCRPQLDEHRKEVFLQQPLATPVAAGKLPEKCDEERNVLLLSAGSAIPATSTTATAHRNQPSPIVCISKMAEQSKSNSMVELLMTEGLPELPDPLQDANQRPADISAATGNLCAAASNVTGSGIDAPECKPSTPLQPTEQSTTSGACLGTVIPTTDPDGTCILLHSAVFHHTPCTGSDALSETIVPQCEFGQNSLMSPNTTAADTLTALPSGANRSKTMRCKTSASDLEAYPPQKRVRQPNEFSQKIAEQFMLAAIKLGQQRNHIKKPGDGSNAIKLRSNSVVPSIEVLDITAKTQNCRSGVDPSACLPRDAYNDNRRYKGSSVRGDVSPEYPPGIGLTPVMSEIQKITSQELLDRAPEMACCHSGNTKFHGPAQDPFGVWAMVPYNGFEETSNEEDSFPQGTECSRHTLLLEPLNYQLREYFDSNYRLRSNVFENEEDCQLSPTKRKERRKLRKFILSETLMANCIAKPVGQSLEQGDEMPPYWEPSCEVTRPAFQTEEDIEAAKKEYEEEVQQYLQKLREETGCNYNISPQEVIMREIAAESYTSSQMCSILPEWVTPPDFLQTPRTNSIDDGAGWAALSDMAYDDLEVDGRNYNKDVIHHFDDIRFDDQCEFRADWPIPPPPSYAPPPVHQLCVYWEQNSPTRKRSESEGSRLFPPNKQPIVSSLLKPCGYATEIVSYPMATNLNNTFESNNNFSICAADQVLVANDTASGKESFQFESFGQLSLGVNLPVTTTNRLGQDDPNAPANVIYSRIQLPRSLDAACQTVISTLKPRRPPAHNAVEDGATRHVRRRKRNLAETHTVRIASSARRDKKRRRRRKGVTDRSKLKPETAFPTPYEDADLGVDAFQPPAAVAIKPNIRVTPYENGTLGNSAPSDSAFRRGSQRHSDRGSRRGCQQRTAERYMRLSSVALASLGSADRNVDNSPEDRWFETVKRACESPKINRMPVQGHFSRHSADGRAEGPAHSVASWGQPSLSIAGLKQNTYSRRLRHSSASSADSAKATVSQRHSVPTTRDSYATADNSDAHKSEQRRQSRKRHHGRHTKHNTERFAPVTHQYEQIRFQHTSASVPSAVCPPQSCADLASFDPKDPSASGSGKPSQSSGPPPPPPAQDIAQSGMSREVRGRPRTKWPSRRRPSGHAPMPLSRPRNYSRDALTGPHGAFLSSSNSHVTQEFIALQRALRLGTLSKAEYQRRTDELMLSYGPLPSTSEFPESIHRLWMHNADNSSPAQQTSDVDNSYHQHSRCYSTPMRFPTERPMPSSQHSKFPPSQSSSNQQSTADNTKSSATDNSRHLQRKQLHFRIAQAIDERAPPGYRLGVASSVSGSGQYYRSRAERELRWAHFPTNEDQLWQWKVPIAPHPLFNKRR